MTLRVKHVFHRGDLVTINAGATIEELNRKLAENRISGAPVLDDTGRLVGVVSQSDIVKLISRDLMPPMGFYVFPFAALEQRDELARDICEKKVSDIMERRVHSVSAQDLVSTAARVMRNLQIHRLLVLEEGRLAGIITALDLLKVLERPREFEEFYRFSEK